MDIPNVPGVEFREVVGFQGYAVGDDGTVWSCRHGGPNGITFCKWKRLVGCASGEYRDVTLCNESGQFRRKIHHVVLEAFVGPRPDGMECRHLDGNKANNRATNVAWGTHIENCDDRTKHGTQPRGERQWMAKLTESDVREIRRLHASGMRPCDIARKYPKMLPRYVWEITQGKTWKHVA